MNNKFIRSLLVIIYSLFIITCVYSQNNTYINSNGDFIYNAEEENDSNTYIKRNLLDDEVYTLEKNVHQFKKIIVGMWSNSKSWYNFKKNGDFVIWYNENWKYCAGGPCPEKFSIRTGKYYIEEDCLILKVDGINNKIRNRIIQYKVESEEDRKTIDYDIRILFAKDFYLGKNYLRRVFGYKLKK